jgi:tRNA threonylcarbamoyladenosine modification (KEOPS) complex  Pcc1 subunit
MNHSDTVINAKVKIFLDKKMQRVIKNALKPEADTPSSDRSETEVLIKNDYLVIETRASDTSALRAALNSYLRWVEGISKIVENIS